MSGAELRKLREDRGVKAAWLAERMGLRHRQQINKIEGKKDVSVDEFVSYTKALDLMPGDLLENSAGDIEPYLPLLKELSRFHPDEMTDILGMLRTTLGMLERRSAPPPPTPTPNHSDVRKGVGSGEGRGYVPFGKD